jgi:hypothetical protein
MHVLPGKQKLLASKQDLQAQKETESDRSISGYTTATGTIARCGLSHSVLDGNKNRPPQERWQGNISSASNGRGTISQGRRHHEHDIEE